MVLKVSFLGFCSLRVSCSCIKWPGSVHGACEYCFPGAQIILMLSEFESINNTSHVLIL